MNFTEGAGFLVSSHEGAPFDRRSVHFEANINLVGFLDLTFRLAFNIGREELRADAISTFIRKFMLENFGESVCGDVHSQ